MSYRTLATIEADIRYRYDVEGFTARHPQANLFTLINDAYRTLRERLTSEGSSVFLSIQEATVTGIGRTSGYPGTLLQAHAFESFTLVNGVNVQEGSSWRPLNHISLSDALNRDDGSTTGIPDSWCLAGVSCEGTTGASPLTQGVRIVVCPSLDTYRNFQVFGLELWTDLTGATDRFATDIGFHEYIMAAVGVDLATRDDDAKLYGARIQERERVYQDIKKRSKNRDPAPTRRVDVRRRRGWR